MKTAPDRPKNKSLIKTGSNIELGQFLMGKDLLGGMPNSVSKPFIGYLKDRGVSESKANSMDYKSLNSYFKRFKGSR
tara:strand:- start:49 stop:279 length:231 start_codon:yes stop_codon:yes gene_type:complete